MASTVGPISLIFIKQAPKITNVSSKRRVRLFVNDRRKNNTITTLQRN